MPDRRKMILQDMQGQLKVNPISGNQSVVNLVQ